MSADWSTEQITTAISYAIRELDFEAVVALLKMLALRDPHLARTIYDAIQALASSGDDR